MSAEETVKQVLLDSVGETTAEFLLACLKEEWLAEEAEKNECVHPNYRNVYDETGVWNRCDTCKAVNV